MKQTENKMKKSELRRKDENGIGSDSRKGRLLRSRIILLLLCVMCFSVFSFGGLAEPAFAATLKAPKVTVKKIGSSELWININKVSKAKGYRIYRSTKKSSGFKSVKTIKAASSGKTKWLDTGADLSKPGLKEGTRYYYKVQAYRLVNGKKQFGKYSAVKSAVVTALGNAAKYDAGNVKYDEGSVLKGQTAYFLGSSVTKGMKADDQSFVELLKYKYGLNVTKQAVNGTTLVGTPNDQNKDSRSYIARLTNDVSKWKGAAPDYFVCQLSTNDASKGSKLGALADGFQLKSFNTQEVAGAIEYITAYVKQKWDCPVIFYIPTRCKDEWAYESRYMEMVDILIHASEKWNTEYGETQLMIINLWDDERSQFASTNDRLMCMYDTVHPTKYGYLKKYLPVIGDFLSDLYKKLKDAVTGPAQTDAEDGLKTLMVQSSPEETDVEETDVTDDLTNDTSDVTTDVPAVTEGLIPQTE